MSSQIREQTKKEEYSPPKTELALILERAAGRENKCSAEGEQTEWSYSGSSGGLRELSSGAREHLGHVSVPQSSFDYF